MSNLLYRLALKLPLVMIREPERIFIGYLSVLVGILMSIPSLRPSSVAEELNHFTAGLWAAAFIAGGLFKIVGLSITTSTHYSRSIRRRDFGVLYMQTGASLIAFATALYAVLAIWHNGVAALIVFFMFMGMAGVNLLRVILVAGGKKVVENTEAEIDGSQ